MSSNVLIAETGRQTGSPSSRRLRREDRIPAVVYGLGMTPISISVDRRDLHQWNRPVRFAERDPRSSQSASSHRHSP